MPGIGPFIKHRRNELEISQKDLANRLTERGEAYAASTVGWWETGRSVPPVHDKDFMNALADALEVSINALVNSIGVTDKNRISADLSPLENELLSAYRSGDVEKVMRILLESPSG